jgi:hypothetical protein
VRRRVVSAPLPATPTSLQTGDPPEAYDDSPEDNGVASLPPAYLTIPMSHRNHPESDSVKGLFTRINLNLSKLYLLLVFIWADLLLLFVENPLHTVYFFSKESSRDVMISLFTVFHNIWHNCRNRTCALSYRIAAMLTMSARHLLETLEWWYSAWRYRVEQQGCHSCSSEPNVTGKGEERVSWVPETGSYWPFKTREEAFEFLDAEFAAPLTRNSSSSSFNHPDKPSLVARRLSASVLGEYLEVRRDKYKLASKKPKKMSEIKLSDLLRCFHSSDSLHDLNTFTAEHHGSFFRFGYVVLDGSPVWFEMMITIGDGMLGKKIECEGQSIIGIAIGVIKGTSHMVVVEPGGRVFLVYDFEDETGEHELIPYTVVSVFDTTADVGSKFDFKYGSEREDYTVVGWSVSNPHGMPID